MFNNVIPAWVIVGDKIIGDYNNGLITRSKAEHDLKELKVPPSMMKRLDENATT